MADELFARIVQDISAWSERIEQVHIGVHGEPLTDAHLEQRVQQCAQSGIHQTTVTTNGSLLDEQRARSLLRASPGAVVFSLESLRAEVYESLRVGLSHDRVMGNVRNFIALRDGLNARTKVIVRFIESAANRGEFPEFQRYWSARLTRSTDAVDFCLTHNWGLPVEGIADYGSSPCPHVIEVMNILSDGTVALCCLDYDARYDFGNVASQSVLDAFNKPAWQEIRRMHRAGQRRRMAMCQTCYAPETWQGDRSFPDTFVALPAAGGRVAA
jgi:molybdenum cofactor biosynthesis enzyme MoaA